MLNDIEIEEAHESTNLEAIKEFEREFDIKLPEDYIEWLLKHNGGHPIYEGSNLIEPMDEKNRSFLVAWFYALYDGEVSNLRHKVISWRYRDLPKELIPIAYTPGGDNICLCVCGRFVDKVYLWSFVEDDVALIANSFTDFINGLYHVDFDDEWNETRTYQDGRVEFVPNPDRLKAE